MTPLVFQITDSADDPVFDRFFAGYDRAFVLPDEKEDRAGFAACLALNRGAAYRDLSARYGAFREVCVLALDEQAKAVGGANFIALRHDRTGQAPAITVNLNYLYVEAAQRGRGMLRRLVDGVRDTAATLFDATDDAEPLIFIEQNDPFAMSEEAYRRDSDFTGLDQFDRLRIWAKLGAQIVDYPYVQPALSATQEPDASLIYAALTPSPALSACLLAAHLRGFFGISVLKGEAIERDETAHRQTTDLARHCAQAGEIALIDPAALLAVIDRRSDITSVFPRAPSAMRVALALFGQSTSTETRFSRSS